MLEANHLILEKLERDVVGTVDNESQVHGNVGIAATASVRNNVVRGPAIIGPGTRLPDA